MPVRRLATTRRRHMTCLLPWMEKSNKSVSSFTRYIVSVTLQIQLFLTIYMCLGLCLPTAIQYYNLKIVTFNYFISFPEVIMISYFYCIFFGLFKQCECGYYYWFKFRSEKFGCGVYIQLIALHFPCFWRFDSIYNSSLVQFGGTILNLIFFSHNLVWLWLVFYIKLQRLSCICHKKIWVFEYCV